MFGGGQTTFSVAATPAGASTALALGSGAVRLNLQACGGPVEVDSRRWRTPGRPIVHCAGRGQGRAQHARRTDSPRHWQPVRRPRAGRRWRPDAAYGWLSSTALAGFGLGFPVTFDSLHSLAVRLSRAGNRLACSGTPVSGGCVLRTGGHDVVEITMRPGVPCQLSVDAPQASQDRLHVVVENASPGQVVRTPPVGSEHRVPFE